MQVCFFFSSAYSINQKREEFKLTCYNWVCFKRDLKYRRQCLISHLSLGSEELLGYRNLFQFRNKWERNKLRSLISIRSSITLENQEAGSFLYQTALAKLRDVLREALEKLILNKNYKVIGRNCTFDACNILTSQNLLGTLVEILVSFFIK